MENIIIIGAIAVCLLGAVIYIYKSKKKGHRCIGCPHASDCAKNSTGCSCNNK